MADEQHTPEEKDVQGVPSPETPENQSTPESTPEPSMKTSPLDEGKSKKDYIIERLQQKKRQEQERREQLEKELEALKSSTETTDIDQEAIGEIFQELTEKQKPLEIENFLLKHPEYDTHKDSLMELSKKDAYKDLPIEQLAYILVGMESKQAEAKAVAEKEADASHSPSTGLQPQPQPSNQGIDYKNMSSEDFRKIVDGIPR